MQIPPHATFARPVVSYNSINSFLSLSRWLWYEILVTSWCRPSIKYPTKMVRCVHWSGRKKLLWTGNKLELQQKICRYFYVELHSKSVTKTPTPTSRSTQLRTISMVSTNFWSTYAIHQKNRYSTTPRWKRQKNKSNPSLNHCCTMLESSIQQAKLGFDDMAYNIPPGTVFWAPYSRIFFLKLFLICFYFAMGLDFMMLSILLNNWLVINIDCTEQLPFRKWLLYINLFVWM